MKHISRKELIRVVSKFAQVSGALQGLRLWDTDPQLNIRLKALEVEIDKFVDELLRKT